MPARANLRWSQLKVGILVAVAAAILIVVIFALTGESGWFSPRLHLITYVNDAGGMRPGASVNLEGVGIGNVTAVHLAEHPPDPAQPVQIDMSVTQGHERWLRTNSTVVLGTAGPLGETLVNINAGTLQAPPARDGTVLPGEASTGINALLVSSHNLLTNANVLEERIGQILDQVQNGKGSLGQLFYSDQLYTRMNAIAGNLQVLTANLNRGQGTAGKLLTDDTLYTKINTTLDRLNATLDQVQHGSGTLGKLMNDPALYNHADQLVTGLNTTTGNLNAGRGALGALLTDSPTSAQLKDSLEKLDALLAGLQAGKGTMGKLFSDPTLYNHLDDVSTSTQALLDAIRANPKKYLTIHLNIF